MREKDLKRIRELGKTMQIIEEQIAELRSTAERSTTALDGLPRGSSMRSIVEESVVKLLRRVGELQEIELEYLQLKAMLADELFDLDEADACVLSMRYLQCKSYDEIAKELRCSVSNVFRMHRRALRRILTRD